MAKTLGSMALGSIIRIKENDVLQNFYVARHDAYTSGRTLLVRQYVHSLQAWNTAGINTYASSSIDRWLNNFYLALLPAAVQEQIAEVTIPYSVGNGDRTQRILSRKVFLLTLRELGQAFGSGTPQEGIPLPTDVIQLLATATDSGGTQIDQWTRTPHFGSGGTEYACVVHGNGHTRSNSCAYATDGVRPAFTLHASVKVDDSNNIVVNQPPAVPASINVPGSISGGSTITVSWGAATDPDGNLEGYIVERSIDGGSSWSQIYQGGGMSTTNWVAFGTATAMYRVKAYDGAGEHSGYRTSAQITVINNNAPSAPASISVPLTVEGGKSLVISWGSAGDLDGNLVGYCLERGVNGGAFAEIFRGNALAFTDAITKGWQTVVYRVRAYDSYTAYSPYITSVARSVNNNTPPTLSCASANGSDLGVKSAGFSVAYTVQDIDSDTVTVTEAMDGVTKRTYTATLGSTNSFAVTGDYFFKVLNGAHTMTITASDGKASATHALHWSKSVTAASFTLEAPMRADAPITLAVLSVMGSIPADASFTVEVTNNGLDAAPVWEDCTAAVRSGANYIFTNTVAANGFAFNFRAEMSRGPSGVGGYATSIQGGFQ